MKIKIAESVLLHLAFRKMRLSFVLSCVWASRVTFDIVLNSIDKNVGDVTIDD